MVSERLNCKTSLSLVDRISRSRTVFYLVFTEFFFVLMCRIVVGNGAFLGKCLVLPYFPAARLGRTSRPRSAKATWWLPWKLEESRPTFDSSKVKRQSQQDRAIQVLPTKIITKKQSLLNVFLESHTTEFSNEVKLG